MPRKVPQPHGGSITLAEKGDVLNKKGRPVGSRNFKSLIAEYLEVITKAENPLTGKFEELSLRDQIIIRLIHKASEGDLNAIKDLLDREMGKPSESVKLSGDTQQPVAITAVKLLREDGISDPIE